MTRVAVPPLGSPNANVAGIDGSEFDIAGRLRGHLGQHGKQRGHIEHAVAEGTAHQAIALVGQMDGVVLEVHIDDAGSEGACKGDGLFGNGQWINGVEGDADVAATDLVSGSRALYSIGVGVIVLLILVASGARAMAAFFGGRIGETVSWAVVGVVVSVIVGSSYAIYTSAKQTADQTGLTTGQFGQ